MYAGYDLVWALGAGAFLAKCVECKRVSKTVDHSCKPLSLLITALLANKTTNCQIK